MRRIRTFCLALGTLLACLAAALCALALHAAPVFAGGEGYELYFGESSSAAMLATQHPFRDKLAFAASGESARFEGDVYAELKEAFRAKLLFSEETDGAVFYYLFSPVLGTGVEVKGRLVNLQIAVRGGRTAAGTPLIYGSM